MSEIKAEVETQHSIHDVRQATEKSLLGAIGRMARVNNADDAQKFADALRAIRPNG